ncbi:zinc finger BED domain-containing protein 6-like isoform 1-T2 [Anomaloglossus baeobatrachus]|uniref:zinc finger BED domain-containing protein 6-like n=1 Tax=Anomaloglossus baeobatrachus TaxID=238106 RepID=UPI003F507A1E
MKSHTQPRKVPCRARTAAQRGMDLQHHNRQEEAVARGRRRAAIPHSTHMRQVPRPRVRCSPVWHFFQESVDDKRTVICNLCHTRISRGLTTTSLTTTSMLRHMSAKHPTNWAERLDPQSVFAGDTTASFPVQHACQSPVEDAGMDAFCPSPVVAHSQPPSGTMSDSLSQHSIQLSLPQSLECKHKYPATHPQAQKLNGHISRLLAQEMLPFRLVDTEAFRNLMAAAVPRYLVPSRHYFSRCAVPALHQHVSHNITRALTNAVTGKVHLTTDTWTNACGQGRYISLTAHWVNLVEAGTESDPGLVHVLPTPRIAGPSSIRVSSTFYTNSCIPSSSSSSISELSSWSTSSISSWKHCSTASVKQQQALLKLICLGDKPHTAAELCKAIKDQTDLWLSPLNLQPGMVVCDNDRNLVAALKLGKFTHVPCLAHVLNLVVQRFLKTYPDLPELLVKVRHVCTHFRKSATAAASLAVLQQRFQVPAHRLVCDVTTRWNSTLHMLARLCEQQRAVVEYQQQHARRHSGQPPHIRAEEWAWMSDICEVLQNFADSTKMVSGDDAIISVTIPLLCLLKRSLLTIKEEALNVDQVKIEEESIEGDTTDPSLISYYQHGLGDNDDDEEEEEEEQEMVACTTEGTTHTNFIPSVQRGWPEEEEEEEKMESRLPVEDNEVLPVGSLAHMADFMSRCLSNDARVVRILANTDYWLFTLLDPRYKENFPSLLPAAERATKMVQYQKALVEQLLQKFPSDNADGRGHTSLGTQGGKTKQTHTRSTRGRGILSKVWDNFIRPSQGPGPDVPVSLTRREKFWKMVKEYLADCGSILRDSSVPYNYWVSKLDTWHELSLYALEVLACPAASVLSERVFSAVGGIITDKHIRISTENADRLTLIKMNKTWVGPDFLTPPDDCSGM